jgi:hypothetical protein
MIGNAGTISGGGVGRRQQTDEDLGFKSGS